MTHHLRRPSTFIPTDILNGPLYLRYIQRLTLEVDYVGENGADFRQFVGV